MEFVKQNVSFKEFMMHDFIYNLSTVLTDGILNVPKIINYDIDKQILSMEKINHMCVSDFYGENEKEIHEELDEYRYRSDREFFKADLNLIKQTIDKILSKY